jgi:hypothetical protein
LELDLVLVVLLGVSPLGRVVEVLQLIFQVEGVLGLKQVLQIILADAVTVKASEVGEVIKTSEVVEIVDADQVVDAPQPIQRVQASNASELVEVSQGIKTPQT